MNTLTLLRTRHIAYLLIAVAILWLIAMLFFDFQAFAGGVSFE